jgi:hypothetical protein
MVVRRLHLNEIRDIIDNLPWTPASIEEIRRSIRKNVQRRLSLELRNIEIPDDGVGELRKMIYVSFCKALIQPGTPMGMLTAETIMGPITQSTLNTFHYAGTEKGANMGIEPVKEMTSATVERASPQIYLHFKDKNLTYDEVYRHTTAVVGVTLQDLLDESTTLEYTPGGAGSEVWVNTYLSTVAAAHQIADPRRPGMLFQRLRFNVTKLYAHGLLLSDVCNKLTAVNGWKGIVCILSPTFLGIVDLHFDVSEFRTAAAQMSIAGRISFLGDDEMVANRNTALLVIKRIIEPRLSKEIVAGVENNNWLVPKKVDTLSTVLVVQDCLSNPSYKLVRINFSLKMKTGVPYQKIIDCFTYGGYPVLWVGRKIKKVTISGLDVPKEVQDECNNEYYQWSMLLSSELPASQILPTLMERQSQAEENDNQDLIRASKYFYALVGGKNLSGTMMLPFVDQTETYGENYQDTKNILGVDASRILIASEYERLLVDPYINPASIMNQVDTQTCTGNFMSMSSRATLRRDVGSIPEASFEKAMDAFAKRAPFGRREDTRSTSSCVALGLPINLGTGFCSTVEDTEMLEKYGTTIEIKLVGNEVVPGNVEVLIPHNVRLADESEGVVVDDVYPSNDFGLPPAYRPPPIKKIVGDLPPFLADIIGYNISQKIRESRAIVQKTVDPALFLRSMLAKF